MALYRRGRIWYADFYVHGKRVQESTGTANRREADRFHALRVSEVARGVYVKPVNISLSDFGERYLAYARNHKRSWKRDEQMLGHLKRFFGSGNIAEINPLEVEAYQQHRIREVCPATVNRETALLKHMFNMAERWSLHQGTNPARLVKFLPENNLQFQTISDRDEQRLLECCAPYLRELVLFGINTGLRPGDIYRLTWEEVDLEHRCLNIVMQKTGKRLEMPLNETAFGIVEARRAVKLGPHVFYNPATGGRFKDLKTGFKNAVKEAGLSGITWRVLRHTFASRLMRSGVVDPVTVKELLGHQDIRTTLRYAHTNAETKARAVAQLKHSDKVVTVITRSRKTR